MGNKNSKRCETKTKIESHQINTKSTSQKTMKRKQQNIELIQKNTATSSIQENKQHIHSSLENIDNLLNSYYIKCGINNYFDNNGRGKLLQFVLKKKLNSVCIGDKLKEPTNCIFTEFDSKFPVKHYHHAANNSTIKKLIIFHVLQHCHIYGVMPSKHYMAQKLRTTSDICDERKHNNVELKQDVSMKVATLKCNDNISKCHHLHNLANIMRKYKHVRKDNNYSNYSGEDVMVCLNSFIHLTSTHVTDEEFEFIFRELGGYCNLLECHRFKRNHRDRQMNKINDDIVLLDLDPIDAAHRQIMDKIHCVYTHCFDIGNRLTINEQASLCNVEAMRQFDEQYGLVNKRVLKMHKILSQKNMSYQNSRGITKPNNKFLSTFENLSKSEMKNKLYGYGFEFVYQNRYNYDGFIIPKKFASFKEEMIQNNCNPIGVAQYESELEKAKIHYKSQYRKYKESMKYMLLDHMLAVMMYCNYDKLQNKFTATYRKLLRNETKESVVIRHSNFYWLGMYLKEACLQCGVTINDGCIGAFYHGINQQMVFPEILTSNGVNIYCPLSTSSSYAVSVNFAANKGLIIEFVDGNTSTKDYSA
eukprot:342454_1